MGQQGASGPADRHLVATDELLRLSTMQNSPSVPTMAMSVAVQGPTEQRWGMRAHNEDSTSPLEELERLLETDESRVGDVYRGLAGGQSAQEIADSLNIATSRFVYNYRRRIEALLHGEPVAGTSLRAEVIGGFERQVQRGRTVLSGDAMALLLKNRASVEAGGDDSDPVAEASANAEELEEAASTLLDLSGVPGIYAFSYGWYLESLVDPERGNTLIKVGKSGDIGQRIRELTSGARAHMPEPLALIRAYTLDDADLGSLESSFHDLLRTAGHNNPRRTGREVGIEWFLTNEDFLDTIAQTLHLRTRYTGRSLFAPS